MRGLIAIWLALFFCCVSMADAAWLLEENFESTTDTYGRDVANEEAWQPPFASGTGSIAVGTTLARPLYGEAQYLSFSAPVVTDRASIKKLFATTVTEDFYARFYVSLSAGHGIDVLNETIRSFAFTSSGAASVGTIAFEYDSSALRIKANVGVYGSVTGTYDFQDASNGVFTQAVTADTWYEVRLSMRFSEGDYGKLYVSIYDPVGTVLMDVVFTAGAAQPTDIADATIGISYATAPGTINMDRVAFRTEEMPFYRISKEIILPNANGTNNWSYSTGTTSYPLLRDSSDATYMYTTAGQKYHTVNFATPINMSGLPIGVRMWHRLSSFLPTYCRSTRSIAVSGSTPATVVTDNAEFGDQLFNYPILALVTGTGARYTWADITALLAGVNSMAVGSAIDGGKWTEVWAEVFSGDSDEYPMLDSILFGGVSTTEIKVMTRTKGVVAQEVKLRYGTVEADVRANTGDTLETPGQPTIAANDYTTMFTVTGLTVNTRYYVDVIVDGNAFSSFSETTGIKADPYFGTTLPSCKTAIAGNAGAFFRFALIGDDQVPVITGRNWENSLAAKSPDFIIHAGDIQTLHTNDEATYRSGLRKVFSPNGGFSEFAKILQTTPLFFEYSDHDYGGDNVNKIGTDADPPVLNKGYMYLDAVRDIIPLPTLANDGDLYGTATGGDTDTVTDTAITFTNEHIYPGQMVWNISDGTYCIVQSVSANSVECAAAVASGSFDAGDTYAIGRGGLYYKFSWGDAEFFFIDTRHKRDYNGTTGGDMLDGMMYGAGTGADAGDGVAAGHLQRDWLVTQINASTAQWKFIVCQIPFKSDELFSDDKWGMYDPTDAQYDYLRTQITADNVVWLAADRHFAGMDDGETLATDPWPVILPGPMYGNAIHEADGEYFWFGHEATFDLDENTTGKTSFAIVDVYPHYLNISIYDSDGVLLSSKLTGKYGIYRGSIDDQNRMFFNAAAADGGKGTRTRPYNAWDDFPFSGYNVPAGAEIIMSGSMGSLDLSGLTDTGAKTVKAWPRRSGSLSGFVGGPNDVLELVGQPGKVFDGVFK